MPLAVLPRPRVRVGVDVPAAELSHSLVDKIIQKGKSGVTNAQIQGKT